jgi:hypothetical protein
MRALEWIGGNQPRAVGEIRDDRVALRQEAFARHFQQRNAAVRILVEES